MYTNTFDKLLLVKTCQFKKIILVKKKLGICESNKKSWKELSENSCLQVFSFNQVYSYFICK